MAKVQIGERLQKRKINELDTLTLKFDKENHTLYIKHNDTNGVTYDQVEVLQDIYECLEDYIIYE